MVLDTFFPSPNIRVGLTLAAVAWTFCLTTGNLDGDDSRYMVPFNPSASSCQFRLQILPDTINDSSVFVTMATKYNETFYTTSTFNVTSALNFEIDLNFTSLLDSPNEVTLFTCQRCSSMHIAQPNNEIFHLYETSSSDYDYVLLLDDIRNAKQHVYIYGLCKNTTVDVGFSDNDTGAITNLLQSYNIDSYARIYLHQNYTKDGLRIKGSDPINILVSNYPLEDFENDTLDCNQPEDRVMNLVPTIGAMGKEFILYTPLKSDIFLIKIIGSLNGNLTWCTAIDNGIIHFQQFTSVVLNFTGSTLVTMRTSVPVHVLTISLITGDNGDTQQNVFFNFALERLSNCVLLKAEDCQNSTCFVVLSAVPSGKIKVSNTYSKWDYIGSKIDTMNITYTTWEISNLTDGVYLIHLYDSLEPLAVFKTNFTNGMYYSLMPTSTSYCQSVFVPNNSTTENAIVMDNSTSNSAINTSVGRTSSVPGFSYNDTNNNNTFIKPLSDRERYPFMYAELPEDDRELNEYMIAVIVSLCTAIFAVAAVILLYLLREVVTKRKQLGNSKIRPFVS